MLVYEVLEDAAIDEFVAQGDETAEHLCQFLEDRYARPHPHAEYLTHVVKTLVSVAHSYYVSLSAEKKPHFLKYLVSVLKFSFAVKVWESRFSRVDSAQEWADKPLVFVWATELVEPLEDLQRAIAAIDPNLAQRRVVLVEGETEAEFIRTIQLSANVLNFDFSLKVYGGKAQVANLVHYIQERNRQGVRVDLSYDSDRQATSFLEKLKSSCTVQEFFGFQRDFENAFPPEVLHAALLEYLQTYAPPPVAALTPDAIEDLLKQPKPFILAFEERFGVNISKPKLGTLLAKAVIDRQKLWEGAVRSSQECSEIAKFLRFVMLW
jgi:hypothetical protein